jgi:hypothetical protein
MIPDIPPPPKSKSPAASARPTTGVVKHQQSAIFTADGQAGTHGGSRKYFTGDNVHGPVRASEAKTFSDVVKVLKVGAHLPITRAEFLARPKPERDRIKQVPFFTAACFRNSPSRRITEEALHCNLIFLDVDDASDAAPLVKNRGGLLYAKLRNFNFVAYETANSTPERPRLRIVVDAHEIPIARYAEAVETIGAILGVRVTPESRNPVQPMYFFTFFKDTNHHVYAQ